jgi:hypothetical protein
VQEVFSGKLAEPRLDIAFTRNFGAAIREGARRGPNFAGKFNISQWGCGRKCVQMAVIHEQSGAVYRGPFATLAFGPSRIWYASGSSANGFKPVEFRLGSRLLIVRGCMEEEHRNCSYFYYEWDGKKFRLLRKSVPPSPPPF